MTDPTPEDRAAARDFVHGNLNLSTGQLADALNGALTDAYGLGALSGVQQLGSATVAGPAADTAASSDDWAQMWDAWQPGNKPAGALLEDGGLKSLLDNTGATIDGIAGTTLDGLGNVLANGVGQGLGVDDLADSLHEYISSPTRAFTIANTETARAVTAASMAAYEAAGVAQVDLVLSPGACEECEDIASSNPWTLKDFPGIPVHPSCRCAAAPNDAGINGAMPTLGLNEDDVAAIAEAAGAMMPALDEAATAGAATESASDNEDIAALSDDDLDDAIGQAAISGDGDALQRYADESDRRQAATDKAAAKQAKKDAAEQAKDDAFNAAVEAGQDPESAYEDAYGVSIEQQRRDGAIASLRSNGYAGSNFDQLSREAYKDQARIAYDQAEAETNGFMLNSAGKAAGINPRDLFTGTEATARKYASDELLGFWQKRGRVTLQDVQSGLLGGAQKSTADWI